MSKQAKDLRKQLRNVVQELLKDTLTKELLDAIIVKVQKATDERLNHIEKHLNETLNRIESRQKDYQLMLLRNLKPVKPGVDNGQEQK